jgi:ribonuclease Z
MIRILLVLAFPFLGPCCLGQNKDSLGLPVTDIKVTLLGTGTPNPGMVRFGPSILVEAGTEKLIFDAGRGCLQRLNQLHLSYARINAIFLTHLHSDHIVGLPDLWLTGWLLSNRRTAQQVFGPEGTAEMMNHLQKAFAYDIGIRISDDHAPEEGCRFRVKDIRQGVVYENNGVRVTAFEVDHYPIVPAFGYRVDYHGHSVVLSGDTRYSENLIKFAKGTDLLIHEVAIAPENLLSSDPDYHIYAHHTSIEQTCQVFRAVRPRLAVYSHIVKLGGLLESDLSKRAMAHYPGKFIIGEDLMGFVIGDAIEVRPFRE